MKVEFPINNEITITNNSESLEYLLDYLRQVIEERISHHFNEEKNNYVKLQMPKIPEGHENLPLIKFIRQNKLSAAELIIVLAGLAPHLYPDFYDKAIQTSLSKPGDFPQIGGVRGKNFRGFLPTGETVLFLLAGNDLDKRFEILRLLRHDHWLYQKEIIWLEDPPEGEPAMSGKLILSSEYLDYFTTGKVTAPKFGNNFPAEKLETPLSWNDLVLGKRTMSQIKEIEMWVQYHQKLMYDWQMWKKIKPGFRVLFHGPPGTGKTLTATLLGKQTGRDVYKIDLSLVVSKYIGETEKNLGNLFNKAANKDWILFFDEADSLFGKRTNVRDAHDKYANQEVSYLLQRIENYPGLIILASNYKSNIDEAFTRRFESFIYYPLPQPEERKILWQNSFPSMVTFESGIDFKSIADKYELSGANIMNVVKSVCLQTIQKNQTRISNQDLINGIGREFYKDGKSFTG